MVEAVGTIYLLLGILIFSLALILAVVSEALVLRRFRFGPLRRSFNVSFVMNITSGVLGFFIPFLVGDLVVWPEQASGLQHLWARGLINWGASVILIGAPNYYLNLMVRLGVSLALSIVSEGLVLMGFRASHATSAIWRMSLVANAVSYSLLLVLYVVIFFGLRQVLFD